MKLALREEVNSELLNHEIGPALAEQKVGVMVPDLILPQEDLTVLKEISSFLWGKLLDLTEIDNFKGLIRFDLVPDIKRRPDRFGKQIYDFGSLEIGGVYELNAHSPEGVAASWALRQQAEGNYSYLATRQPNAVLRLAKAMDKAFNGKPIAFVAGDGVVKNAWADLYFQALKNTGVLEIEKMSPREAMKKDERWVVYRWGDVDIARLGEEDDDINEFEPEFVEWLIENNDRVINTVPETFEQDVANKGLLLELSENGHKDLVGDSRILDCAETLRWGLKNQEELVLKPLRGSSGNGIKFGVKEDKKGWRESLEDALENDKRHGLFHACYLPRMEIPSFKKPFSFDVNPAFFADGKDLTLIHVVTRADLWQEYWYNENKGEWGRLEMNVAQGAGYHGSLIEKEKSLVRV